jgi:hypothetical protein
MMLTNEGMSTTDGVSDARFVMDRTVAGHGDSNNAMRSGSALREVLS